MAVKEKETVQSEFLHDVTHETQKPALAIFFIVVTLAMIAFAVWEIWMTEQINTAKPPPAPHAVN